MVDEPNVTGASSSEPEPTTPTTPEPTAVPAPEPIAPTAKVEVVDGQVTVDGKKFVAESHLIAAKKSLEGDSKKAQTIHDTAIDAAKLELSNAQQELAKANANIQTLTSAQGAGATSAEEVARVKAEAETAKSGIELAKATVLELRRANIILQSGGRVNEEQLKEKSIEQLDSFEEAFKALGGAGSGSGNYALGAGGGDTVPMTDMDRAAKVINDTPIRGVRDAVPK